MVKACHCLNVGISSLTSCHFTEQFSGVQSCICQQRSDGHGHGGDVSAAASGSAAACTVLVVVNTVACCLDLIEGVLVDPVPMEDTAGLCVDKGYLHVDLLNVLASLHVRIDARLDLALASELFEVLVVVEAELADFLVGVRVVVGCLTVLALVIENGV